MAILSVFLKYPKEAAIIGRLLAGYGELEFDLLSLLAPIVGSGDTAAKVLFRARGEEQRILIADALSRNQFPTSPTKERYAEAIADLQHCRRIRNQYAHCHWSEHVDGGLSVDTFEDGAKTNGPIVYVRLKPISLALLEAQEAYFEFVSDCFAHLITTYRRSAGLDTTHDAPWPKKVPRPPLHN